MSATVLPDAERIVSEFVRSRAEVSTLVDARVYTELPKKASDRDFPIVRLTRTGGGATTSPRFLDRAILTFDVWGGTKYEARLVAETLAAVLDDIAGYTIHGGYATGSSPGSLRYLPDETFEPAKPRYSFDVIVLLRPTP
jgi:hypothetical protein